MCESVTVCVSVCLHDIIVYCGLQVGIPDRYNYI